MLKLVIALAALAAMLWFGMGRESAWLTMPALERVIHLSMIVTGGAATYFATLWLLGFRLRDFRHRSAR